MMLLLKEHLRVCQNYLDMIMVDEIHLSIITGELSVKIPI